MLLTRVFHRGFDAARAVPSRFSTTAFHKAWNITTLVSHKHEPVVRSISNILNSKDL